MVVLFSHPRMQCTSTLCCLAPCSLYLHWWFRFFGLDRILPSLQLLPVSRFLVNCVLLEQRQRVWSDNPLCRDVVDSLGLCPLLYYTQLGSPERSNGVVVDSYNTVPRTNQDLVQFRVPGGPDDVAVTDLHLHCLIKRIFFKEH